MLTIDLIVEKYCSLSSEDGIAANQRRHGFSPADIEKSIKVRRAFIEKIGTAAKPEEQIDRFRSELILLPRAEQIARYLWLFGSFERSSALWTSTFNEPPDVFWPVVLEAWSVCDGLWPTRKIMLSTLKRRAAELSPIGFMSSQDRAFYDQLPGRVTVFRGCSRRRVRGLPWTTDRKIAEFFARGGRLGRQPDPVIASAEIAKADLFFVSVSRDESEVVLDPYLIKRLRLEGTLPDVCG
jgi:hypothetical protein